MTETVQRSAAHAEVTQALFGCQQAFETLVVRGIEAAGSDDVARIASIGEELSRAGARYVAGELESLVRHIRDGDRNAPRVLLRAQTTLRVFERVLSLDVGAAALAADAEQGPEQRAVVDAAPALDDKRALVPVLEELARTVERLIASGLTTASKATKQKLDASFKEASRLKLLRVATSLRYVGDELQRFLDDSEHFSARRLTFFAHRTWLLARGLLEAIAENNQAQLARLLLATAPRPVKRLRLAVLGVQKRALLDGSAAFEFRMTVLDDKGDPAKGTRLLWSCVFGAKKNVPAEAFLHLPQPQKFVPTLLLEQTEIIVTDAAVTTDQHGYGRLVLGPKSTVTAGKKLSAWSDLLAWDPARFGRRLQAHRITPLDIEVELQEELVLTGWELQPAQDHPFRSELRVFPIAWNGLVLDAVCSTGPDGEQLFARLAALAKPRAERPALYGVMHVEMGRLVVQPLTLFGDDGPEHLMMSGENIDLAALMKTMDFRS
ncbi:MAG: hypothetical protein AB7P03_19080 [Kofleriaceae bacterium]